MGRPSKLTDAQWNDVERRLLNGETARSLGRQFGLSEAAIRKKFGAHQNISAQSAQVRTVAEKLAEANMALIALPPSQRPVAIDLSEKLRNISTSLASAAEHGAATSHRLHALANETAAKIDDADVFNGDALRAVAALTDVANKAAIGGLTLLSANRGEVERARQAEESKTKPADSIVTARIAQLMAVAESRKKAQEQTA